MLIIVGLIFKTSCFTR